MRAFWTGTITYGIARVPVKMYPATHEHGPDLHQVHAHDGGRISYRRFCKDCGEEVEWADMGKGYEVGVSVEVVDGKKKKTPIMVTFTDAELAEVVTHRDREMEIVQFVDPGEIDPVWFGTSYYVAPPGPKKDRDSKRVTPADASGYVLLREALRHSGVVAIARVVLRSRESMVMLRVEDDMIVAQLLRWADEINAPVFDDLADGIPAVDVPNGHLDAAVSLISALTDKWDPTQFVDGYAAGVAALVEAKRQPEPEAVPDNVTSLLDRLNAAVGV